MLDLVVVFLLIMLDCALLWLICMLVCGLDACWLATVCYYCGFCYVCLGLGLNWLAMLLMFGKSMVLVCVVVVGLWCTI